MAKHYFGMLQGPFNINENILSKIKKNHSEPEDANIKIIKLGICAYRKFDLITPYNWNYYGDMEPHVAEKEGEKNPTYSLLKLSQQPIIVQIKAVGEDNIKSFRLGITNILELEDVNLESVSFNFDQKYWEDETLNHWTKTDDSIYVNYIIKKE